MDRENATEKEQKETNQSINTNYKSAVIKHQLLGALVLSTALAILFILLFVFDNNITFYIGISSIILYFANFFIGPAIYCKSRIASSTMQECEKLFNDESKCCPIKSMDQIAGEFKGEVLAYNLIGSFFMNGLLIHGWFGKSFYGSMACSIIVSLCVTLTS